MASFLVVDDAQIMRMRVSSILKTCGHTVLGEADTGTQAIIKYELLRPDFVTMDITMPNMDGITALKKIIEKFPDAKIIMISALGQKFQVLEALKSGARNYLVKPIEEKKIIEVIQVIIQEEMINKAKQKIKQIKDTENTNSISEIIHHD